MSIISIPDVGSGGTDWSAYTRIWAEKINYLATNINTYETILNISGKGFISACYVSNIDTATGQMKITVDDSILLQAVTNNDGSFTGFASIDHQVQKSSADYVGVRMPLSSSIASITIMNVLGLPFNDEGVRFFIFLPKPIFFNTSFKFEVQSNNTSKNILYTYMGGVM